MVSDQSETLLRHHSQYILANSTHLDSDEGLSSPRFFFGPLKLLGRLLRT